MSPAKMPAFYALPAKVLGYAKRPAVTAYVSSHEINEGTYRGSRSR